MLTDTFSISQIVEQFKRSLSFMGQAVLIDMWCRLAARVAFEPRFLHCDTESTLFSAGTSEKVHFKKIHCAKMIISFKKYFGQVKAFVLSKLSGLSSCLFYLTLKTPYLYSLAHYILSLFNYDRFQFRLYLVSKEPSLAEQRHPTIIIQCKLIWRMPLD